MDSLLKQLEERVSAAAELIRRLRLEVASLEAELASRTENAPPAPPAPEGPAAALLEEVERLRAERVAVRERIRALIREIDAVSW